MLVPLLELNKNIFDMLQAMSDTMLCLKNTEVRKTAFLHITMSLRFLPFITNNCFELCLP